jgi:type II secretion system protein J
VRVLRGADTVAYTVVDGDLMRGVGDAQQRVLTGVTDVAWAFLDAERAWVDAWPMGDDGANPQAVAFTLDMGAKGQIRRVVAMPSAAE